MKNNNEDVISLREFARRLGVNERKVRYFILTGKLSKCVTIENEQPKILFSIGKEEAASIGLGNIPSVKSLLNKKGPKQTKKPIKPETEENDEDEEILSYAAALQYKENWNAKIKELEYLEKKETLVNKADVYSQLFDFGKEIRSEFESLPGRIGSKIALLGSDVSEIEKLLANEIRNSLLKLVENMEERKIN